ncbi:MAG: DUF2877 domain-containing protein [Ramlibacter sp.]
MSIHLKNVCVGGRPLAVSTLAMSLLRDAVPFVRAVHPSGLSLAVPGSPDICYLGAQGRGLLPLHVVVRQADLAQILRLAGEAGNTSCRISLDLDGVRVFRLVLQAVDLQGPSARIAVDQVAAWLRMRPEACGLGEPPTQALSADGRIRRTLAAVEAGPQSAGRALRALIGRGAGSTPAGDDVLVGALAHAFASGTNKPALVRAMLALMPEFDQLTTAAGATYLRAAVQGVFGGDLLAFVRSLPNPAPERALRCATRVACHGATSGIDSLLGFVAAHNLRCAFALP